MSRGGLWSFSALTKMYFSLILLLGIYGGIQANSDCSPRPSEKNIALTGEATQISVDYNGFANLAIDGNSNTNYYKGSCSHTSFYLSPWWRLDLKRSWKIGSIVVVNRGDCCSERLQGAQIRIGNSPDNNNPTCGIITDIRLGSSTRLCCHGMEGRYVSVVMPSRQQWLTICEVEVYPVLEDQNECRQLDHQPLSSYSVQTLTLSLSLPALPNTDAGNSLTGKVNTGKQAGKHTDIGSVDTNEQQVLGLQTQVSLVSSLIEAPGLQPQVVDSAVQPGSGNPQHRREDEMNSGSVKTVSSLTLDLLVQGEQSSPQSVSAVSLTEDIAGGSAAQAEGAHSQGSIVKAKDCSELEGEGEEEGDATCSPQPPEPTTCCAPAPNQPAPASQPAAASTSSQHQTASSRQHQPASSRQHQLASSSTKRPAPMLLSSHGSPFTAETLTCTSVQSSPGLRSLPAVTRMHFSLIFLLGVGIYGGSQAASKCYPVPNETNIAPTGIASQSSTRSGYPASLAIDGNSNNDAAERSCTHTDTNKTGNWWRLDLRRSWNIAAIVLVNRGDCCSCRLKGAQIRIGNSPDNDNPVCGNVTDTNIKASSIISLCCNGMNGRYVSVILPKADFLTLCEVKVFPVQHPEDPWINIAPLGIANQSSLDWNGFARLAIDENPNPDYYQGFCTHTLYEVRPWWQVDLQQSWKIRSVEVVNRGDCCPERLQGAQIRIGNCPDNNNPVCGTITDTSLGTIKICCNGMEGRYVSVVLPHQHQQYLTLCEVRVFPALQNYSSCE
ncbi:uncharacterized protein LOC115460340 [Microcaecilia unicolor]|uniref:Uncharacterized protein LOC115460340 n=1 Tax=Microcaecilia unicolor TaxID=1415580 RepID=A0A6P7X5Z6_9AMPH|nr:uncharacterized protein LOC115460340 [Microcaecilia unicolor]